MTSLAGAGTLTRLALRRDRIMMAAWIYALAVVAYASVAATKKLYTSLPWRRSPPPRARTGSRSRCTGRPAT
jgi:ABC-2 type transport system permease protein